MTDKTEQNKGNWDIVLIAAYFFMPFYGLRIAVENYLMEDDLEIEYTMLLGLISTIAVIIYVTTLKNKALRTKLIGLGIILMTVVLVNILMR